MKESDSRSSIQHRMGLDISPRTPGRAHPHLLALVQYLEKNLPDVQHFYKGGFFIGEYTKEPRYTQDVDMNILELSAYERVKEVLSAYGDELEKTGVISNYRVKDSTSERSSGGAKYYAPDGSILFSIDIGFQEEKLDTVAVEMGDVGQLTVTTAEQMMCDKLSALFSSRRQRRIKDLYDAWHLLTTCDVNKEKLVHCLAQRGLYPLKSEDCPFTDANLGRVESAFKTLRVYSRVTGEPIELPDFWDVVRVVGNFCCDFTDAEV